jgi:hypothetical protein
VPHVVAYNEAREDARACRAKMTMSDATDHTDEHPYRTPPAIDLPPLPPVSRAALAAVLLVGIGVESLFVVCCWPSLPYDLGIDAYFAGRSAIAFGCMTAIALGLLLAFVTWQYWRMNPGWSPRGLEVLGATVPLGVLGLAASFVGYMWTLPPPVFVMGRRLRSGRRLLSPAGKEGSRWAEAGGEHALSRLEVPDALRAGLAEEWRRAARNEHAAIAAFGQVALELIAVGAPPELVADAHAAAMDEVRHTRTCFSIARALDGREEEPGAFPEARHAAAVTTSRSDALVRLACDAVIDGALNEGVAGRVLAKLAPRCASPELGARLREMAADESRHAAHSWRVIEYCLAEGGAAVRDALGKTLRELPAVMTGDAPAAASDGAWEAWGVQGRRLEAEAWSAARAGAVRKLSSLLSDARPSRAAA